MLTRRAWLQAIAAGAAVAVVERRGWEATRPDATEVVVYKTASCGCCARWVDHLREAGFVVTAHDVDNIVEVKERRGVAVSLRSCHTALVEGYVVEGHVPADLVRRLLRERPEAAGLAVPGMPLGSPGMEAPQPEPYDILLFQRDGSSRVYASR